MPSPPSPAQLSVIPQSNCGEVPLLPLRLGLSRPCLALESLSEGTCSGTFPQAAVPSSPPLPPAQYSTVVRQLPALPALLSCHSARGVRLRECLGDGGMLAC